MQNTIIMIIIMFPLLALFVYALYLVIKVLRRYVNSKDIREEKQTISKYLGEVLKEHRTRCKLTQEFVAEHLGVYRQAVSKWESGQADPKTTNLIALAKLYGVTPEELVK